MKKLAILFLLATVLVSFTFAQVSVKGGLEFNNAGEGNKGKRDVVLYTDFVGTSKTDLGPGAIGAELGLGAGISFQDALGSAYTDHGDIYLKGFYELPAGPGALTLAVSTWPGFGALHLNADYAGLVAGPATLGFGVEYDFNTDGTNSDGKKAAFSDEGKEDDLFVGKVTADFGFGLHLVYKLKYAIRDKDSYISEIAYLDISYDGLSIPLVIGVELSGTGDWGDDTQKFFGGDYTDGIVLKPYVSYQITEKVSAGLDIPIANINADSRSGSPVKDIEFSPGIWVKYAF